MGNTVKVKRIDKEKKRVKLDTTKEGCYNLTLFVL